MKPNPIKGQDFDNIQKVIEKRKLTWQFRLKRELWLEKVCRKIISDNNLGHVLWLARAFDHPDIMNATSITIKWKLYYPYVIGDPQYDKEDEIEYDLTACSIFINVTGSQEDEFVADVHFDYTGKSGIMSEEYKLTAANLQKETKMPQWFSLFLEGIVNNNSNFCKQ